MTAAASLPPDWTTMNLKRLASLRAGDAISAEAITEDGDYPVYGGNGLRGYTTSYTHAGDHVLIGRQGALCGNINLASGRFWASEHAVVATPAATVDVRWLAVLLEAMNLNQYSQSAAQPGISVDLVGRLPVPVPPPDEQRAIADYLDRETARIDALVASRARLGELLGQRREAEVARLFEIARDEADAVPLWTIMRPVEERDRPDLEILSVYRDHGVVPKASRSDNFNKTPEDVSRYLVVEPGDVVVNKMKAWQGSIAVSQFRGIVSPDYLVCRVDSRINPKFLHYVLRCPRMRSDYSVRSEGIRPSQWRLQWDQMRTLTVPMPPPEQQASLATTCEAAITNIDALADAASRQVAVLRERRQALIIAAVSGQIQVAVAA